MTRMVSKLQELRCAKVLALVTPGGCQCSTVGCDCRLRADMMAGFHAAVP